jgi:hypothetical protein
MNTSATATGAARQSFLTEYDAISAVMERYNEGVRTGSSTVMKPAFHEVATFFGYYQGGLIAGPIQVLFDWVEGNGAAPNLQTRTVSVDIAGTIAAVRVDLENLHGKLAGEPGARLSDHFQLLKVDGEWKIIQKSFHWHAD